MSVSRYRLDFISPVSRTRVEKWASQQTADSVRHEVRDGWVCFDEIRRLRCVLRFDRVLSGVYTTAL